MRVVVCDAGPILHLSEAGALGLLERVGEILIPTAVDREVAGHVADWPGSTTRLDPGAIATWATGTVGHPDRPLAIEVHGSLGVVLWAATQRQTNPQEAAAILERLAKSSLWVSPAILAEARRALDALQG